MWRPFSNKLGRNIFSTMATELQSSTIKMDGKLYNALSKGQLKSHSITYPALSKALSRVGTFSSTPLCICDFGAGPGSNSVILASKILDELDSKSRPIQYFFNDLPSNDFNELSSTIESAGFPNHVSTAMIGKSFYQQIFPNSSVHLSLSYICLHWLSRAPCQTNLPHVGERGTNPEITQAFSRQSDEDLLTFLKSRLNELVPGGEGIYMWVSTDAEGNQNEWLQPSDGGPSPLSRALSRAVAAGDISQASADKVLVPIFFRQLKKAEEIVARIPGLELTDSGLLETRVFEGDAEKNADAYWSIISNSIRSSSGLSSNEMQKVRFHVGKVIEEVLGTNGVNAHFAFIAIRKSVE